MSNNPDTYQNDNIKITLKREPGCRVHLEVHVSPEATKASHHQALKTINKEVSIPGFRKGKAPEALIIKSFGSHVEKEWKDVLLNTSFNEALTLTKIFPFNKNSIKSASIKSASLQEGSILLYEYEESPQVPQISPSDLNIKPIERKEVSEEDVSKAIEELRLQKAEWVDVADRPVQENDYVDIDIDVISEPARNVCTQSRFAVAPGKMDAWMRRLIIGMNPGSTVEGMSEKEGDQKDSHEDCQECADGSHDHKHEEFQPALCRFMLHSIKQAKLAALDDDFAKQLGASSLEDLKEKVKINLNKRADEYQANARRTLMEQALVNKYSFDIPHSLVQAQIKENRKGIIDRLRDSGVAENEIQNETKKIEENISHKIERDMRLYFIMQNVARENQIQVAEDEVMLEWMRLMWMQQSGNATQKLPSDPKEAQAQLHLRLLSLKALDFLIEQASKV